MFQFTSTTVINTNKDLTTGLDRYTADANAFSVKRVGKFKKDNVVAIYKRVASEPKKAKITFAIPSLEAGNYRIALYVRLSGSNNSYYSNDMVFKGKPLYIEFLVKSGDLAATVAARIVKNAKKYLTMIYETKLLEVSNSEATVTIEAVDEYQRFAKAELQKFNENAGLQTLRGYMGEFQAIAPAATVVEAGKEGFGTYTQILKDLRVPTAANTRWNRIAQDESPIPGAEYNQYTVVYCTDRGIMGGDAVGMPVKSQTTHVFYVKKDLASGFEAMFTTAGVDSKVEEVTKARLTTASVDSKVEEVTKG